MQALHELPDNTVPLARIHKLLDNLSKVERAGEEKRKGVFNAPQTSATGGGSDDEDQEEAAEALNKKALHRSAQMQTALKVTADLWDREAKPWPQIDAPNDKRSWAPPRASTQQSKSRQKMSKGDAKRKAVLHQCRAYIKYRRADSEAWLEFRVYLQV